MRINGTLMPSTFACGGIALLTSAMKAMILLLFVPFYLFGASSSALPESQGIPISPYTVRKALENTSASVCESLADKLSTRAYQVDFRISVQQITSIFCDDFDLNSYFTWHITERSKNLSTTYRGS